MARKAEQQHRDAFISFHEKNPHVLRLYKQYAYALLANTPKGAPLSIGLITERIRWEAATNTVGDPFKINNNFRAHYARALEIVDPVFKGRFEFRQSAADRG